MYGTQVPGSMVVGPAGLVEHLHGTQVSRDSSRAPILGPIMGPIIAASNGI